jgi:hypothetical protein
MAERDVPGIAGKDVPGLSEIGIVKDEDEDAEEVLAQKKRKEEENRKNEPEKEVNSHHPLSPEKTFGSEEKD